MSLNERVGMSLARLGNLDRIMREKYVDPGKFAGTVTQVWRRGELVHNSILGAMDRERGKAMREDTICRIYSLTKPVIGAALLVLMEDGKIALDDDVAAHIPSWKNLAVYERGSRGNFETKPPNRPMKVIDLATHTAGLTYGWMQRTNIDAVYRELNISHRDTKGGLEAMIEQLAGLPLEYSPGEAFNYSVAMDVLGYLIQKISGEPLGVFLKRRLFDPLDMADTGFVCPPSKTERLATSYKSAPGDASLIEDDGGASRFSVQPQLESGGGGLVSTVGDYMRFCRMLLGGGVLDGVRVLSPKSTALFGVNFLPDNREFMQIDRSGPVFLPTRQEGLGMSICCGVTIDLARTRMLGTVGTFTWSGAPACWFWVDPFEDLAVVFLTQMLESPHHFTVRRDLHAAVYGAFTESNAKGARSDQR